MSRRWSAPLAIAALGVGLFAAAGPAAAAPVARPSGTTLASPGGAFNGFDPGLPIIEAASGKLSQSGRERATVNWSGYAKIGGRGAFRTVSASWRQPAVTCRSVPHGHYQYAYFWVGLDGFTRTGVGRTVEQTGIGAECHGTTPSYFGWYDMYPVGAEAYSNTVRPGDLISASVTFNGGDAYTLVLKDRARGWKNVKRFKHFPGRHRSSAEVITEAPGTPLANFGKVRYLKAATSLPFTNANAAKIIMEDAHGNQLDSTSALLRRTGDFSIRWIRSN